MAKAKCTDIATRGYNSGWQTSKWQDNFVNNGDSDGYCNSSTYSNTHGFVFRFKTPAIDYLIPKSTELKITIPVMFTSDWNSKTSYKLYFKLLASDPTPENTTSGSLPDSLKVSSSGWDVTYNIDPHWNDPYIHKVSFTIKKDNLQPNYTYYIAVGGSHWFHIGYGYEGYYYDADKGSAYKVSEFSPSKGYWAAELIYETYEPGTSPTISIVDNGNNTVKFSGTVGGNKTNNKLKSSTLYYTTNGKDPTTDSSQLTLSWPSSLTYNGILNITKDCTVKGYIVCDYEHGTDTSARASKGAKYYAAPSTPGKPVLSAGSYKNNRLTIKQNWTYTWTAATQANSNSPVKGYRIRIYKNGEKLTGLTCSTSSNTIGKGSGTAEYVDRESTSCTITFNPVTLGFLPKDTIKVGIYAYTRNGAGTQLWSDTHMISDILTVQNAGIVQVKVNNTWKEGQVWVKVNGAWKEAETVNVKVNGSWKESQ